MGDLNQGSFALDTAKQLVYGDRNKSYGSPKANHTRTAQLWSAYLGVEITARQVCMLNILQKVSRDKHSSQRDNAVDIAGYAENAELVLSGEEDFNGMPTPVRYVEGEPQPPAARIKTPLPPTGNQGTD